MDDRRKAAFEFARESTTQLITLATGILTITVTLVTGFREDVPEGIKTLLAAAWVLYVISLMAGAWTLLALTGSLEPIGDDAAEPSIRGKNIVIPSMLQIVCFLLGTGVAVAAGIRAL